MKLIQKLKRLNEQATQGEWRGLTGGIEPEEGDPYIDIETVDQIAEMSDVDKKLICLIRNNLPKLIDLWERATCHNNACSKTVICKDCPRYDSTVDCCAVRWGGKKHGNCDMTPALKELDIEVEGGE